MTRGHVGSAPRDASHSKSAWQQIPPLSIPQRAQQHNSFVRIRGSLTPDSDDDEIFKMADASAALTKGALARIASEQAVDSPILQCVQIKPMASQSTGADRYRVVMNDSVNFIQGMITQREFYRWLGEA